MSVLVLSDAGAADLPRATRSAVTAAQQFGMPVDVLVIGQADAHAHARIAGVRRVRVAQAEHLAQPLAEDVGNVLESLAAEYTVVVAAHNGLARSVLPRLAARRDVGMVSDVLAVLGPNTYQRAIYAGNLVATVRNQAGLQILTVRAARFAPAALEGQADIDRIAVPPPASRARWVGRQTAGGSRPELGTARVVVSGGRSMGSAEQFQACLAPLADTFGAALGATRAAVDAGYAPNEWQVGQTGTVVAPELYLAVGLSGAQQHLAGIKDSQVIVAINQDPDAPIMQVADYTLVADLFEAVPQLVQQLQPRT